LKQTPIFTWKLESAKSPRLVNPADDLKRIDQVLFKTLHLKLKSIQLK